jgi:hypothetical protein
MNAVVPRSIRKVYLLSDIVEAMRGRYEILLYDAVDMPFIGVVNGMRVEDGSGRKFLVTLLTKSGEVEIFIKVA